MSNLTIEKFYGGWSLGSKSGPTGSCRFSQGLNYKDDPDYITANKALVKDSSTVIVDLPKWITSYNSLVYVYGDGGRIYQNSAGTYTVLKAVSNSKGQGMAVYDGYLYYRQNSQIGRMKLSDNSFTDNWQTSNVQTVVDFAPMATIGELICFSNGRYLATYNGATFVYNKLGFMSGRHIRDLGVMGEYLVLAVNDNEDITQAKRGWLYFWDGTSSTYNFFTEVLEGGGVSSIQANQEAIYIFTGSGNIYRYNGATNKIKKIPYIGQSSTIYVYPGAETNYKGLCLFGLAGGTSTTVYRGVYSWGQPEIGYPEGLNFEYPISAGVTQGTTVDIGCVQSIGNDLYIGWKSGTTYGVDKLSTTTNQLSVSYESLVVTTTNPNAITREKLFFKPLASGESITVYIKINQASTWTEIGNASYTNDGAVTIKLLNYEFRCDDLEIKVVLTGTSTMPSLSKIVFEYEEEGNL